MFKQIGKKIIAILRKNFLLIWPYADNSRFSNGFFQFQVFFSSYIFSANVMVKVATRPADNPVSTHFRPLLCPHFALLVGHVAFGFFVSPSQPSKDI